MFSFVYMKVLESQPGRYDAGITLLSLGTMNRARRRLADQAVPAEGRLLEIGCGTGALTVLVARRCQEVVAFDASAPMLAVARRRIEDSDLASRVRLEEKGVSGMDAYEDASFDAVVSALVFSELSGDERAYALRQAYRVLRPGGRLALLDEVTPETTGGRLLHALVRWPLRVVTFLLTQTTTLPVDGLADLAAGAGFRIEREERSAVGSTLLLLATKEKPP